jgi:hypothetical protein
MVILILTIKVTTTSAGGGDASSSLSPFESRPGRFPAGFFALRHSRKQLVWFSAAGLSE